MNMLDFDGERLKAEGMARAELSRKIELGAARGVAIRLARSYGTVTVDDVRRICGGGSLGPAWGSVFTGREWEWTGEWKRSTTPSNHARMVRVWRLK